LLAGIFERVAPLEGISKGGFNDLRGIVGEFIPSGLPRVFFIGLGGFRTKPVSFRLEFVV
jgi:hypothetical protein